MGYLPYQLVQDFFQQPFLIPLHWLVYAQGFQEREISYFPEESTRMPWNKQTKPKEINQIKPNQNKQTRPNQTKPSQTKQLPGGPCFTAPSPLQLSRPSTPKLHNDMKGSHRRIAQNHGQCQSDGQRMMQTYLVFSGGKRKGTRFEGNFWEWWEWKDIFGVRVVDVQCDAAVFWWERLFYTLMWRNLNPRLFRLMVGLNQLKTVCHIVPQDFKPRFFVRHTLFICSSSPLLR